MDKKKVYFRIVRFLKEYHRVCIYSNRHDDYIYGYMMGLVDSLYYAGLINVASAHRLSNYIMKKAELYFDGSVFN